MMFFFSNDNKLNLDSFMLELGTLSDFLNHITVNAILIGSSNQSFNTYYGRGGKADKGESDLLMFSYDKERFSRLSSNLDSNFPNIFNVEGKTIFEGNYGAGIKNPNDYMKGILKDFLENALA